MTKKVNRKRHNMMVTLNPAFRERMEQAARDFDMPASRFIELVLTKFMDAKDSQELIEAEANKSDCAE